MNGQSDQRQSSPYVRPHQKWVCGSADVDCPCPFGPDKDGNCSRAGAEKCKPRWSLRTYRGSFTIGVTLFLVGSVLIGIWKPWRADFLAPGPLAASHAQLLTQETADQNRCAACHEAGQANPVSWIVDTFSGGQHLATPQSQKCMNCHDETLNAELALAAHNVDAGLLKHITAGLSKTETVQRRIFQLANHANADIACAACHREHHGANHDLAAMTNTQCQTCHQNQFASFAKDHPDFGDWSTRVSLGIEFDHAAHLLKHFSQTETAFDCRQCHVDDARGNVKLLASFENSCASCHEKPLDNHLSGGVQLVALPIINKQQLENAGYLVGDWPQLATGSFDGKFPPLMKVLLSGDPNAKRALQVLGDDFEFTQMNPEDDIQLAAAADLIRATKQLVYDLAIEGEKGLRERLEESLNRQINRQTVDQLVKHFSRAALLDMQARWFPNLQNELSQFQQASDPNFLAQYDAVGNQIQLVGMLESAEAQELLHENPISGIYGPALSRIIYDKAAATAENIPPPAAINELTINPTIQDKAQANANQDPDLLHENPLKGYGTELVELPKSDTLLNPVAGVQNSDGVPPGTFSPSGDKILDPSDETHDYAATPRQLQQYPISDKLAGWVRDDLTFTLTYHPHGHADPFVKAWLDLAIQGAASPDQNVVAATLQRESNPSSGTGYCLSCHQATKQETSLQVRVNWQGSYRDTSRRSFTWFSHAPHVIQTSLNDCESCHELDKPKNQEVTAIDYLTVSDNLHRDRKLDTLAASHHSDFLAIGKKNCSECHHPNAASQNCTLCHHYHIGSRILSK